MPGSNLFGKMTVPVPHLESGKPFEDVRKDMVAILGNLAALTVDEFTNPVAGGAALLKAATATVAAPVTVLAAALLAPGLAILAAQARNVTFTTAGGTAADAPATATITGTRDGVAQTEVVNLAQTATIALGVKLWHTITSIVYTAADGTGATVAIGIGDVLPLSLTPKARAGLAAPVREIAIGALVTTGTLSATNRSYTPAAAPNATNDYAVYFEWDTAAVAAVLSGG